MGRLVQISCATDGSVWGVNKNDYIYTRIGNAYKGSWKNIPGRLINVSVGNKSTIWGCNRGNLIYYRNGVNKPWRNVPGRLKQIHVDKTGFVVGANIGGYVYKRNGKGFGKSWTRLAGRCKWMTSFAGKRLACISQFNDSIWYKPDVTPKNTWRRLPGALRQLDFNDQGILWGVNKYNTIYTANGKSAGKPKGKQMKAKKPKTKKMKKGKKQSKKAMKKKASKKAKKVMKKKGKKSMKRGGKNICRAIRKVGLRKYCYRR